MGDGPGVVAQPAQTPLDGQLSYCTKSPSSITPTTTQMSSRASPTLPPSSSEGAASSPSAYNDSRPASPVPVLSHSPQLSHGFALWKELNLSDTMSTMSLIHSSPSPSPSDDSLDPDYIPPTYLSYSTRTRSTSYSRSKAPKSRTK